MTKLDLKDDNEILKFFINLVQPYDPLIRSRCCMPALHKEGEDETYEYDFYFYGHVRVIVVLKGEGLNLIIQNNDYIRRGFQQGPDVTNVVDETWIMSDPDSINSFHRMFRTFIKGHYAIVLNGLIEQVENYDKMIKEVLDDNPFSHPGAKESGNWCPRKIRHPADGVQ